MTNLKNWFLYLIIGNLWVINILFAQSLFNDRDEGLKTYQKYKNRPKAAFSKELGKADRGVAILDRGELANVTGNFGVLSNFHLFAPAFHWPSWVDDTHQYCFGLELLVGVKGDVVTSIHDPATVAENFDWEAQDNSYGELFSGNVTASDGTPLLASSDNRNTWPLLGNNNPFWPGPFRYDPQTGGEKSGEFVSERDIYAVFTDQNNVNGSYGLVGKQRAFSFSRSYARDFIIFDFQLINTSADTLDSVWVGYMADFKVDFDTHDHIRFISLDPTKPNNRDLVYLWDADPFQGIWDVTGYIGFLSLFTPQNTGITDFHYFDNIYEPSTNKQLWEIMTSDTSGSHITTSIYFHGDNYRLDDDALADDLDPSGQKLGTDFVFIISTGQLTIPPADSVHSAFAVVMGGSREEMLANAETVKDMAKQNYLGPNAPPSPQVQAFASDRQVTVTWDGNASETAGDLLSGKLDFEGYRIYRSTDYGLNWGNSITDERGNLIGYVPIAQYDLDNTVSGKDPNSNFYLGNNTGLKHTFIDSTVNNGVEYWYSVTAYDAGDITTSLPALESPRGVTPDESNVVSVIPTGTAANLGYETIPDADSLPPEGGICHSKLSIQIIDPTQLTGHQYRITFTDVDRIIRATEQGLADTTYETTFNLIDLTTQDTLITSHPLLDESKDNVPVVHGFRIFAQETEPAVTFLGWTLANDETCTFDWRITNFDTFATHPWRETPAIYTSDDYRITVDHSPNGGSQVQWYDIYTGEDQDTTIYIPLKIEIITDPDNPIEIGQESWLGDYDIFSDPSWHDTHYSPLGWDLEPGGAGYNPNYPWGYIWPDVLLLERKIIDPSTGFEKYVGLKLFTQNFPDNYFSQGGLPKYKPAVQPSAGDEFTIQTKKLFRSEIYYEFQTYPLTQQDKQTDLGQIKVVPNPFIVRAGWEQSQFEGRLQFTNLPKECEIAIYSTAGDHIITLQHNSFNNSMFWNLQNDSGVNVAYGLYVFVVKTPDGEKHTGKFVVIR
jgi:hypothetical protein